MKRKKCGNIPLNACWGKKCSGQTYGVRCADMLPRTSLLCVYIDPIIRLCHSLSWIQVLVFGLVYIFPEKPAAIKRYLPVSQEMKMSAHKGAHFSWIGIGWYWIYFENVTLPRKQLCSSKSKLFLKTVEPNFCTVIVTVPSLQSNRWRVQLLFVWNCCNCANANVAVQCAVPRIVMCWNMKICTIFGLFWTFI